ncbi:MAG TPA: hypothetical protein VLZ81_12515 [Blastocatellia bacterium]|nr:hypothetical protein [Blastocatellia bacterium]
MVRNLMIGGAGLAAVIVLGIAIRTSTPSASASGIADKKQNHYAWLSNALKEAETIGVGSTRAALLKVFTTEGGLSTGLQRTYVHQQCPLIKVDVEFAAVGRPERDAEGRVTVIESGDDVIVKISRPYLAWPVDD